MEHKDTKTQSLEDIKSSITEVRRDAETQRPSCASLHTPSCAAPSRVYSANLCVFVSLCSINSPEDFMSSPLRASASLRTKKYSLLVC